MPVYSGIRGGRGSGGGGGARVPTLISNTDFADIAALETFASSNAALLLNNANSFSTAFVAGDLYYYEGIEGVYVAGQWVDATPEGLTPEMRTALESVVDLPSGRLAMGSPTGLAASLASQPTDSIVMFDGEIGTTRTTLRIGDNLTIGEDGAAAVLTDTVDGIRALPAGTLLNPDGSTGVNVVVRRDDLQSAVIQSLDNETVTGNWEAWVPITADRIIKELRVRFAQTATGVRFTMRQADNQTQTDGPILYRSHTDTVWNDGGGFTITPSPEGGTETYAIDLENSAKVIAGKFVYLVVEQNASSTGQIEFRGATLEIAGVTQFYAYLEQTFLTETRDQIALAKDIAHPVTLRRDMPTEVEAQALVDASLNNNSALWVTAADQLTSSNRSDALMFALQAGFLDVDGNLLPTTPVAANTLQLRGGSTVRLISANEYRIVNSPVLESDVSGAGGSSLTTSTGPTDSPVIAPTATNQQLVNQAVDGAVATLQNTIFNSGRGFVRFNDGFTIDDSNLATFADKNIIYTAKNDKPLTGTTRPDVFLPTDADIAAAGESYPIVFEFTHLGGTSRSTTTNLLRLFFEGAVVGQLLRDDASIVVKEGVGQPYTITTGNFDPNDTILPTGVFNLKVDTPISDVATIASELAGISIVAGDAYLVETGGDWSGLTIPNNSILVATINSPSLVDSVNNNDWLLLDNPRVNAKSASFLANVEQDGIRFNTTRNIQVDPANVFEFSAIATGVPQTRELGTNSQGAGRSIAFPNVPIQFTDLVGGRLAINLNFNVTSLSGFAPAFTSVRLAYPSGITFDFPVNGTPINGNFMATIDIPNIDYSAALNQDCTLTLFFDFFGASFFGEYSVLNVINTAVGRLHEPIVSLIASESTPLEARLQAQIDNIIGEVGDDEASFAAIQDRISPYRNNIALSPDINVRYLDSTGSDAFPAVSTMTAVNPLNTQYTMGTTAVFIAVATGVEQAVVNGGTQTLLTSANANTDPNLELGESSTFEGRTYFVYRLTNQTVNDVIQTFDLTSVQVVAWQDDINTLDADINRIDAELKHAALNLSDPLIDVLDNNVQVAEESTPTIVPTDYNKSFSTDDTQTVFYESSPKAPSGGQHSSDAISGSSTKLVVIPENHTYVDGVILQADNGAATTDLVSFVNGQLIANVFVPAIPSGSKTVTVHPLPATQVQKDWYSIALHTSDLRAEADELFFTRDVPVAPVSLNFTYRYDANGGHGTTQSTNLVITDIAQDASIAVTLSLPDGESVDVTFDWQAAQRRIRVAGTPFASDPNFFIFDMEVGVTFTETRTTPAVPATTRPVVIGAQRVTGQDAVLATKVSSGGDLILVGDVAEVDTNYSMTELFGVGLTGNLIVFTELGTYLNYTQFSPSAQTVVSLENHATLPQFGLFTTIYTSATVVTFDAQLEAKDSLGGTVKLGQELVLIDTVDGDRYQITIANGVLIPVKL